MSTPNVLQRYYRWHAPVYDLTRWIFLLGRAHLVRQVGVLVNNDHAAPKRILDVGCGTGKNLMLLANAFPNAEIVACDLAPTMLEIAKKKIAATPHKDRIRWHAGTVQSLPDGKFDLIVCSYMLSMTGVELPAIVAYLRSRLSESGRLAVVDFADSAFAWFARWMAFNHVRMDGGLQRALAQFALVEKSEIRSAGLWRWLLWIGAEKQASADGRKR